MKYLAFDGKIFDIEEQCRIYEHELITKEQEDFVLDWLYENYYDPWTEEVTYEQIKEDIKHNPMEMIYGLISMIDERGN